MQRSRESGDLSFLQVFIILMVHGTFGFHLCPPSFTRSDNIALILRDHFALVLALIGGENFALILRLLIGHFQYLISIFGRNRRFKYLTGPNRSLGWRAPYDAHFLTPDTPNNLPAVPSRGFVSRGLSAPDAPFNLPAVPSRGFVSNGLSAPGTPNNLPAVPSRGFVSIGLSFLSSIPFTFAIGYFI
jgi:hypothetical protein